MRIKAVVAYDGSRFMGYQCQKHTTNTISSHLYHALKKVGIESKVVGSGRTDRGVHATGQVIHFDIPSYWNNLTKLQTYLNRHLAPYIKIRTLQQVDQNFHARYSAKRRAYRYILSQKPLTPFTAAYKHYHQISHTSILIEVLKLFEGEHDFRFFMKSGSDTKSSIRTIYKATLYEHKDDMVFYIEANGFLRAQIRMMVDFLLKIDQELLSLWQLKIQLEAKERFSTSLAPPSGLYLCRVIY
ncbi:tRNA pseudouridine38-40 synthase [Nitratiruptor sp. YY08-26]|uniref:tRNA pseudouridine(38-40) synthase TruA n=1 Tax=unclassified Nitratiruptor TaxID=2624044 RepID=UPI001914F253|nr:MULTISPECIES: tRNA pseudouridine(38-40) synthase TruA [unclassified Nitratiruptor]BCD62012.1 tRNA pseudouridine38-40 synthase [Nitratiruptor sp. YY08-13]BCD65948.1 tRNA pseudouridine38-40 synthase [Nitratiruptor sp. YY08-26]